MKGDCIRGSQLTGWKHAKLTLTANLHIAKTIRCPYTARQLPLCATTMCLPNLAWTQPHKYTPLYLSTRNYSSHYTSNSYLIIIKLTKESYNMSSYITIYITIYLIILIPVYPHVHIHPCPIRIYLLGGSQPREQILIVYGWQWGYFSYEKVVSDFSWK